MRTFWPSNLPEAMLGAALENKSLDGPSRVCSNLHHFCLCHDGLQQGDEVDAPQRRYLHRLNLTAQSLHHYTVSRKALDCPVLQFQPNPVNVDRDD